jgi:hypothetical protein
MHHRLNHHLQTNNISVAEQNGFRKGLNWKCGLNTHRY